MVQSKINGPPSSTATLPKVFLKTGGSVMGSGCAVKEAKVTDELVPSSCSFSSIAALRKQKDNEK